MKDFDLRILIVLVLAVALFSLTACNFKKEARASELKDLLGLWFDMNSTTKLEVAEKELTITMGDMVMKYPYEVETVENVKYLSGKGEEGNFEFISKMEFQEDGSLVAYEWVLDATPHEFKFVREEVYKKGFEIRDLSTDAPKTIESKDITRFKLVFYNDGGSYNISENWPRGPYDWEIKKQQDDSYMMHFTVMGDSFKIMSYSEKVEKAFVDGLAQLIQEQGLPKLNGYYKKNEVKKHQYDLRVEYESGETLKIGASGNAADTCVFEIQPFLDYASRLGMKPIEE